MIRKRHLFVRNAIAVLAATPLLWIAPGVNAQTSSPSPQESKTYQNDHDASQDKKIPAEELAQFDQFLDKHREISEQLRRDPSLVRNQQFMQTHPELLSYLQDHPQVRQDLTADPDSFLGQQRRHDRREDLNRDETRNRLDNRQDNDARQDHDRDLDRRDGDRRDEDHRAQLAQFDRFLDTHRETAEQLRRNPSLVNNQQFLQSHPALQTYLQQHQDLQQRLAQNPNGFMRQEDRFDNNERDVRNRDLDNGVRRDYDNRNDHARASNGNRRENDNRQANDNRQDARDRDADNRSDARRNNNADRDVRDRDDVRNRNDNRLDNDARQDTQNRDRDHGQVASFDQFLDKHKEIAEQLRRDPSLARNQQFVSNHPALQAYLQDHQGVREELNQNPNAFMQQENRYESRENGMGRNGMNREQYSFGQFLGTHSGISEQLSKNPSLLKNREYMSSHPELQAYLNAHPDAQSQMAKDPDSFMKTSQQFSASTKTSTTNGTTATVKSTTPDATKPATEPTKPPKQ